MLDFFIKAKLCIEFGIIIKKKDTNMLTTKSVFLVLDSAKVALHESEFRIILIYLHLDLPMSETSQI